jgi:UTP--glucose-1-phosphate uridylyltransferase
MEKQKVRKAVIAAAGFGTRFLPQTKSMPKEMLPIVDRPIIQYIVEDMVAAGIEDIIIVGSSNKRSIEDHFDLPSEDLLANLRAGGPKKQPFIDQIEGVSKLANFIYIRQKGPYGTATPIMNAAHLIGNEPFIFAYADDITIGTPNAFRQMIDHYEKLKGSILPCIEVSEDFEYNSYGIVAGNQVGSGTMRLTGIVEKPGKDYAPSNFASVGGYLLTPAVFGYIEKALANLHEGKEFVAAEALILPMILAGEPVYGCKIAGKRYDTGDKLGYLKTVVDFALKHDDIKDDFRKYLESITNGS